MRVCAAAAVQQLTQPLLAGVVRASPACSCKEGGGAPSPLPLAQVAARAGWGCVVGAGPAGVSCSCDPAAACVAGCRCVLPAGSSQRLGQQQLQGVQLAWLAGVLACRWVSSVRVDSVGQGVCERGGRERAEREPCFSSRHTGCCCCSADCCWSSASSSRTDMAACALRQLSWGSINAASCWGCSALHLVWMQPAVAVVP